MVWRHLISVPTQVYFVSTYGNVIIDKMREFKLVVAAVLGVLILVWLIRKVYMKNVRRNA